MAVVVPDPDYASVGNSDDSVGIAAIDGKQRRALEVLEQELFVSAPASSAEAAPEMSLEEKKRRALELLQKEGLISFDALEPSEDASAQGIHHPETGLVGIAASSETMEQKKRRALELLQREGLVGIAA